MFKAAGRLADSGGEDHDRIDDEREEEQSEEDAGRDAEFFPAFHEEINRRADDAGEDNEEDPNQTVAFQIFPPDGADKSDNPEDHDGDDGRRHEDGGEDFENGQRG